MKQFTRDATIRLKFNFRDHAGAIINPIAGANVSLTYTPHGDGEVTTVTFPLVQDLSSPNDADWNYEWDSSVSAPCVVHVHAQTNGGPPTSAIDTEFRLKANRANKELVGES